MTPDREPGEGADRRRGPLVAGIALIVLLGAFVIQNTDSQEVSWLVFEVEAPMWSILAVTAVAAALITWILSSVARRRR